MNFALECGLNALRFSRDVTFGLLEDIPADKLCHQPIPGANHAVWVLGHMANTDDSFLSALGARPAKFPESWGKLFGQGSTATPNASDYPSLDELKENMNIRREELTAWFSGLDDDKLAAPLPENLQHFASNHAALLSSIAWHEGLHAGQLTIVRKSLGIGPKFG